MPPDLPLLDFAARPGGAFPLVLTGPDDGDQARRPAGGPPLLVLRTRPEVVGAVTDPAVQMAATWPNGVPGRCPLTGAEMQDPDGGWLNMDGPAHHAQRHQLAPVFSRRAAYATRPAAQRVARDLAATLPAGEIVDVRARYARPFAATAVCAALGVRASDWPQIDAASRVAFAVVPGPGHVDGVADAWDRLYGYWTTVVTRLRGHPDGSLASQIIETLPPDTSVSRAAHVLGVVSNGFGAVEPVLSVMLAELAERPGPALLAASGQRTWEAAVTTLLATRALFPVDLPRVATADTWLAGRQILAGTLLLPSLVAARLPFGAGPHTCPGAALSRIWLAAALEAFWERHPSPALAPLLAGRLEWERGTLSVPREIRLAL